MRNHSVRPAYYGVLSLLIVACGAQHTADAGAGGGAPLGAAGDDGDDGSTATRDPETSAATLDELAADGGIPLECPHGGAQSVVSAVFRCDSVISYTCKDLSNIVLEFSDGTRQRFEGLNGHVNRFAGTGRNAGKTVTRVWIKAGPNHSGDGPGYGERIDAPEQSCPPPAAGSGGDDPCIVQPDGSCAPPSDDGGAGGSCVIGPDNNCAGSGPGGGTGGVGGSDAPL